MFGASDDPPIRTPDQRLRVFVSSTLGELEDERVAARAAIEQLRLLPVMFELGARPHPPRALYRAYLEQSDVFVGIYWQRYGWIGPDMEISGLEDEFRLSTNLPRLMYLKRPAPDMEPRLRDLLTAVKSEDTTSYKPFSSAEELQRLVLDDLAILLTERFSPRHQTRFGRAATVPQPTTPLVGRDAEVARVAWLLAEDRRRLVTLTGAGGIGKTRLAIAAADATRDYWADGEMFVDLSAVTDPAAVMHTVLTECGMRAEGDERPLDALVRGLGRRRLLLILDNFEQVAAAAPDVAKLVQACPSVAVLVTSRVVLRIRGEVEWPVAPLETAPAGVSADRVRRASAVQLLIDRARDIRPSFEVTDQEADVIAELCRRLDGLPLAIELATARMRLLTPRQVLERLDQRLDAPGTLSDLPERQRTLNATLDWSYGLLDNEAQKVFARLASFSGPFTLEGAEQVAGWDGTDVIAALSTLVDHSLLTPADRPDGEPGLRMLETVRAYAADRLHQSDDWHETFRALERYVTHVFAQVAPRLQSADQHASMRRLDANIENLFSVLRWARAGERMPGDIIRAFTRCWVYWQINAHAQRLPDFSDAPPEPTAKLNPPEWAAVQFAQAGMLFSSARYEDVVTWATEVLHTLEEVGEPWQAGMSLTVVAISRPPSELQQARTEFERALNLLSAPEDWVNRAYALSHFGDLLLNEGDRAGARAAYEQALEVAQAAGDPNLIAECEFHLAYDAVENGDAFSARRHVASAIVRYRDLDHVEGKARCVRVLAAAAMSEGDARVAARLIGSADALRDRICLRPWPSIARIEEAYADRARRELGAAFEAEVDTGRQIDADTALRHTGVVSEAAV